MKLNLFIVFGLFLILFSSCNESSIDTKGISEELQRRKIVRVTEAEIFEKANKTGEEVVYQINNSVKKQSDSLAKAGKINEAILTCSLSSIHNMDSLAKAVNVLKISKIDSNFRSSSSLSKMENELIDAYKYNKENKLEMKPNLQVLNDTLFVYMSPIPATICPEKSPSKKSDFKGIWSIYLNKRDLVLAIQSQQKKK